MSIYEKLISLAVNNGMFEDSAKEVFVKFAEEQKEMEGRWSEDCSAYPEVLLSVLWFGYKKHILAWIDKNKPEHWAREMFV